ncbi:MAG: hypothetical protein IJ426_05405 [Clostridia bacterium]|nr:hypothetical protein [Clostridia bacterium]
MKTRKNIAGLLSFLMVLSLLLGISAAPVYAVGGEGETASFEIREANGQTGTVQYKLNGGEDFTPVDANTSVDLNGVTSITIKAIPSGEAQVNQSHSSITGTAEAVTFDYTQLISDTGWTYQIQDNDGNITFTIEFDNNSGTSGTGGGEGGTVGGKTASVTINSDVDIAVQFRSTEEKTDSTVYYSTGDSSDYLFGSGSVSGLPESGTVYLAIEPLLFASNTYTSIAINGTSKEFHNGTDANVYEVDVLDSYTIEVSGASKESYTIMWTNSGATNVEGTDYASSDCIIGNGKAYVKAVYDNATNMNDITNTITNIGNGCVDGDGKGYVAIEAGNVVDFAFIPDYGFQLTAIGANDTQLTAQVTQNEFRFIMPNTHIHFNATFTPTEDIVAANSASISEGGIALSDNELTGGSAVLEVNEAIVPNQGDFEAAAEGYVVSEYLDISLYNVFYKGKNDAEDVWRSSVESLNSPAEITLKLQDGIDTETVKIVHEKGVGEFELLDAAYNPETQEITFSTSSFSNYAIAYEESGNEQTDRYAIFFTDAPWMVDGVKVDIEGREPDVELMRWVRTEDVISLTNFDPDTMDAVLIVDENVTLRLNVDENGNTRLADVDGGVEVLPPSGAMIFSVVKKPVDNEEFETESYTLTDDKGNVISLTYEKNRELSFTMIDYLAFSPEELEAAGIPQPLYDSMMEGIANATKQHGTLLSFYEIQVENDDGFLIHEGPFYIKIKMTDEMKEYDIFKIVYLDVEDNFATEAPITLTRDGEYLVGTLEHLSTYALVGDNAPTSPQTGDNSNLGLWMILSVLSSCLIIALLVIDKKKKIVK